jgi:non-specific serine/threonine protein kinase
MGMDILDGLSALVDQSLLRQEEEQGEPRFVMLETIREFALERLEASGEADEIRRRHAIAFLALAERSTPHLMGPHQAAWLDRLEREHDNLRAAIGWAIDGAQVETGLRLGSALWRFWQMRGHLHEARERLSKILALPGVADHPEARAKALEAAGGIAYWQADFAAAQAFYEEALAIRRVLQDPVAIADAMYNLAFAFFVPGKETAGAAKAEALLEESLALYTDAGERAGIAKAHWGLAGLFSQVAGDFAKASAHLDISLPILRELDDRFSLGWALHMLGLINLKTGNPDGARAAWTEALTLFAGARDVSGIALLLDDLSSLAVVEGHSEHAARLAGAAAALQASSGVDLAAALNEVLGRARPGERGVDQEAIARAWEEGRAMSVEAIVSYALQRPPER